MQSHTRRLLVLLLAILVTAGSVGGWHFYQRSIRLITVGDLRIDPKAEISPERRYNVVVWESDTFIPGIDPARRRAALEEAAAELSSLHPNITVSLEFVDFGRDNERLLEALEAGVGPDIAGLSGSGLLVDPSVQVPVTPYMPDEVRFDLLPSVVSAVTYEEHIWVWPRWISLSVWLGARSRLGESLRSASLTQTDLTTHGPQWRQSLGNRPPLVYNAFDPAFFGGIMAAATGRSLLGSDGTIQWTESDLEAAAGLLQRLIADGLAPRDADAAARSRLSLFWQNQAAVIGPVNSVLLHHALSRTGDLAHAENDSVRVGENPQLAILSAPLAGDRLLGTLGHVAGYAVFLREKHAGDDHTAAAMLVAKHLSQRAGAWEAAVMLHVPAYSSGLAQWEHDVGLPAEQVRSLTELAAHLVAPPVEHRLARLEREALNVAVLPHVIPLLQRQLGPQDFAAAVVRDTQAFLSSHAGKS